MHGRSAALRVPNSVGTIRELERNCRMGSSDWIGHAGFSSTFEAGSIVSSQAGSSDHVGGEISESNWGRCRIDISEERGGLGGEEGGFNPYRVVG